jgi:nitrogenase molybdenum-cofactor synthesis protein NifE
MIASINKHLEHGCGTEKKDKVCRSRGGESCAFDGAMIALQPIADAAHVVHGPISCCGNSWEGRGSLSSKGNLQTMGFTTDMTEMDIVYGSEEKLLKAVVETYERVKPKAIFVYATCVSGLIGEDIESVCKKAETTLGIRVIPVNAPGFVGPKNLGNRIAGEALLQYVIGTSNSPVRGNSEVVGIINLIGEYNIAGDLWLVEPVLRDAGIRILSRITGDSTFQEITCAHKAKLNVVVCSRALINVAKEMERKYGIPYIEASFFGKTEMSKALRAITDSLIRSNSSNSLNGLNGLNSLNSLNGLNSLNSLNGLNGLNGLNERIEYLIAREEEKLIERLAAYTHLRGKKAVLYSGGVKSWSFISALFDLGIEVVAVGTKKSTFEDEEKMRELLGDSAVLTEDVTPKNLLKLLRNKKADMLIAGGRNQYLAVKHAIPFVDINQERHTAYAGYDGLVNFARDIDNAIRFYSERGVYASSKTYTKSQSNSISINPLKHSQSIGAAMAFQGIDRALPIIHGAQGCTFLGKVLLTKHFREPIALSTTKLFVEDVVMGSEDNIAKTAEDFIEKNKPSVVGVLTSGLAGVKGDNVDAAIKSIRSKIQTMSLDTTIVNVPTPDYEGGLETGYAKAVEALISIAEKHYKSMRNITTYGRAFAAHISPLEERRINVIVGHHLTPADFYELREIIESFGLAPIILPDLSCLDGSRTELSALASGGSSIEDIKAMGASEFTLAIGGCMQGAAEILREKFGIQYRVFESIAGLEDTDSFMETLQMLGCGYIPKKHERQRKALIDGMRDAQFYLSGKKVCVTLEPALAVQTSRLLYEAGCEIELAVIPQHSVNASSIAAKKVIVGDISMIDGELDLIISNSHAEDRARDMGIPLYELGFPSYKTMGACSKITIGYRGTQNIINETASLIMKN